MAKFQSISMVSRPVRCWSIFLFYDYFYALSSKFYEYLIANLFVFSRIPFDRSAAVPVYCSSEGGTISPGS